ncbi:MAG: glycoside hydrolase family 88 protein [Bacteroidales bacterium]|nr:glycoside hydrolase family 88 protein [Bacteroidales bacterium]
MMSRQFLRAVLVALLPPLFLCCDDNSLDKALDNVLAVGESQLMTLAPKCVEAGKLPKTFENGELKLCDWKDWVCGFFPGTLWEYFELTGKEEFKADAQKLTALLSEVPSLKSTHDLGFMVMCSYGHQYKNLKDEVSRKAILDAAESLCSRFDPNIGLIRSWDWGKWNYAVIVDNMMNLELLFEASELTGDGKYWEIALKHADKTIKEHFRPDGSSYHVVSYNDDGTVESKGTHQGLSDESVWARGQAWGLYGYTMCYRYTMDPDYLDMALKIADFIINDPRIPEHHVPFWDYLDHGNPDAPRDASAAAITASALLELCSYSLKADGQKYYEYACSILRSLASDDYLAAPGENGGFLLKHCTGNLPGGAEVDVPLSYADYYFLEAIQRYRKGEPDYKDNYMIEAPHPRLFIGEEEFSRMSTAIAKGDNAALVAMHNGLEAKADACVADTSLPRYIKDASGRRILHVSRRVLDDVFACAYMYRFSKDRKYLDRSVAIMDQVCSFPDWNPSHYLDTGEMALAVGVGYDWLYDDIPEAARERIREALDRLALSTAEDPAYIYSYQIRHNNWNQVCNGGIICAALAIWDSCPDRAAALVRRSVASELRHVSSFYAPDGIYPEGFGYWGYGTEFQVVSNMALQHAYGTDFGLGDVPGFARSVRYIQMSIGNSGLSYNFSDGHASKARLPVILWYFADRHNDRTILQRGDSFDAKDASERLFPLYVISAFRAGKLTPSKEEPYIFHGQGTEPMVLARTGSGPEDLYLAVKGGKAAENHAHMDAGSFVFDAYGKRWSGDPGIPAYAVSEVAMAKVGKNLWDKNQGSWRWKVMSYNNIAHSTLTINGKDHLVDSTAVMIEVFDSPEKLGGRFNLTPVFGDEVDRAERTAAIIGKDHLEIRDRILAASSKDAEVRWTLATYAVPEITDEGILLRQGDDAMLLRATGADLSWRIWSSDPKDYDSPVAFFQDKLDCALCGFEFVVPAGTEVTVTATLRNASPALE